MRRLSAISCTVLCLALAASVAGVREPLGRPDMRARPVPLYPDDPGRTRIGALRYLGGVSLSSRDGAFGGFSAMQVAGDRFTLLSDAGTLVRFRMGPDFVPREIRFGELPAGPRTGWLKSDRDSESLTTDPATGEIWVGFERYNEFWRYDSGFTHGAWTRAPRAMGHWNENGGPESLVRLADGRFVTISETTRPEGGAGKGRVGVVFARPSQAIPPAFAFTYLPPAGYDPSDMTQLPDGRLVVLNRRFTPLSLFTAKLVLLDPRAIRPGATVQGREIAHFAAPALHDNFEGVAATREGADTILWLVSDDNQYFWQRSLLLKFRLEL